MGITDLPPELICRIFEFAADYTAVNALARTCRALHSVWLTNSPAIFYAVAIRILPNYPQAEYLAAVQEEAHNDTSSKIPRPAASHQERLLSNAHCASAACKHWNEICQIEHFDHVRGDDSSLKPSERARFKRSFYQLWTLAVLASTPSLRPKATQYLEARDPIELAGLDEMATWAYAYNENEFGDSGLDFKDDIWPPAFQMVHEFCTWDSRERSGHKKIPIGSDAAPMGFWVFYDHTQHYLEQIRQHW